MGYRDDVSALELRRDALTRELAAQRLFGPPGSLARPAELQHQARGLRALAWPFVWLLGTLALFVARQRGHVFTFGGGVVMTWGFYLLPLVAMAAQTVCQLAFLGIVRRLRADLCSAERGVYAENVRLRAPVASEAQRMERFRGLSHLLHVQLDKQRAARRVVLGRLVLCAEVTLLSVALMVAGGPGFPFGFFGILACGVVALAHLPHLIVVLARARAATRNLADFSLTERFLAAKPAEAEEGAPADYASLFAENEALQRNIDLYKSAEKTASRVREEELAREREDLGKLWRPGSALLLLLPLAIFWTFCEKSKIPGYLSWDAVTVPFALFAVFHAATLAKVRSTLAHRFVLASPEAASIDPETPPVPRENTVLGDEKDAPIAFDEDTRWSIRVKPWKVPHKRFESPRARDARAPSVTDELTADAEETLAADRATRGR